MTPLTKIICIYAQTEDLKFLNPVRNRLTKLLGPRIKTHELTNQNSGVAAQIALKQATGGLVIIFTHGNSSCLRGGEYRNRIDEISEVERFLSRADLGVFAGKAIFCMSCDSNGLAKASLDAGALAFIGFDDIPFNRFDDAGEPIGTHTLIKHSQELLAKAVQATLERFITGRATLDESVEYLRLWIDKNTIAYVRSMRERSVKECREVAALLLRVKDGVKYHGTRGVRFKITD